MNGKVTVIYPDGTVIEETLDCVPRVGEKMGTLVVARIERKGPDDEVDTETRIYLQKTEE